MAIIGSEPQTDQIVQFLKDRIRLGMIPHMVVDGHASYEESALAAINYSNIRTVILVTSEMSADLQKNSLMNNAMAITGGVERQISCT